MENLEYRIYQHDGYNKETRFFKSVKPRYLRILHTSRSISLSKSNDIFNFNESPKKLELVKWMNAS